MTSLDAAFVVFGSGVLFEAVWATSSLRNARWKLPTTLAWRFYGSVKLALWYLWIFGGALLILPWFNTIDFLVACVLLALWKLVDEHALQPYLAERERRRAALERYRRRVERLVSTTVRRLDRLDRRKLP